MALKLKNIFVTGSDQVSQTYTIESWHVSQSVDAFTGAVAYDITLSGSFTLTGSQDVKGAISASNGPNTVGFFGTSSWAVSSSRAVSSSFATSASYAVSSTSASYALSSSYAVSASYALSSSYSNTPGVLYPSGSVTGQNQNLKFIAGGGKTGNPTPTLSININEIISNTLGLNCFITTAVSGSPASVSIQSKTGATVVFESAIPSTEFYYTIIYI